MKYEQGSQIAKEIEYDLQRQSLNMVENDLSWEISIENNVPKRITTMPNFYIPYCM